MAAIAVRFILKPGDGPGAASHGKAAGYIPSRRYDFLGNPLLLQELLTMEVTFVCAVF